MKEARIKKLIRKGEGISIEFKESRNKLNKDVFESICAFLNRNGGDLILGVNDRGKITGIDPENFSPFPKNSVIARFFKEIGRADELGSGVRNLFKYCRHYSPGKAPELIEEDIFKCIIPLSPEAAVQVTGKVTDQVTDQVAKLLKVLQRTEADAVWAMDQLKLSHRPTFRENYLHPALKAGLIEKTIPDKPRSSKQKYRLKDKGMALLEPTKRTPERIEGAH